MSLDLTDDNSTLAEAMVRCRQATSHYLNQCWPRSMSPYEIRQNIGHTMSPQMKLLYLIFTAVDFAHYSDVIMGAMASQITNLSIVYSTINSDADQRKHQISASLAFVRGIHRWPVNSAHKWPVTRKMFPFDDVIIRMSEKIDCVTTGPPHIKLDGMIIYRYCLRYLNSLKSRIPHIHRRTG